MNVRCMFASVLLWMLASCGGVEEPDAPLPPNEGGKLATWIEGNWHCQSPLVPNPEEMGKQDGSAPSCIPAPQPPADRGVPEDAASPPPADAGDPCPPPAADWIEQRAEINCDESFVNCYLSLVPGTCDEWNCGQLNDPDPEIESWPSSLIASVCVIVNSPR